jgi:tetratricopeptide (TPR) repeat protein
MVKFVLRLIFLLFYCIIANISVSNAKTNPALSDSLEIAYEAHQKGEFQRAIENYRTAIKIYENLIKSTHNVQTLSQLCTALHNIGYILHYEKRDSKKAIKYFRRATVLRPSYFEVYHHLGQVPILL